MQSKPDPVTVLVVDDEKGIRDGSQRIINRMGCTALTAENGKEGLGLIETNEVAIVLLDLKMPGIDGIDHTAAIRHHGHAGVDRHGAFDTRADQRLLGLQRRHGLALHVGAHQGAVGVIVLEERHQRGGDRNDLLRRHVHVVDVLGLERTLVGVVGNPVLVGILEDVRAGMLML